MRFLFAMLFTGVLFWSVAFAGSHEFEGKRVTKFTKEWVSDYHTHEKHVYHAYIKDTDGVEHRVEVLHGPIVGYHKDGKKKLEGTYRHGKREGLFTMWAANGTKTNEMRLLDGKRQGKYTQWANDGRKMREENYKDDKLDGETSWWDPEGRLLTKGIYKAGQPWDGTFAERIYAENARNVVITYEAGKKIREDKLTAPWWW